MYMTVSRKFPPRAEQTPPPPLAFALFTINVEDEVRPRMRRTFPRPLLTFGRVWWTILRPCSPVRSGGAFTFRFLLRVNSRHVPLLVIVIRMVRNLAPPAIHILRARRGIRALQVILARRVLHVWRFITGLCILVFSGIGAVRVTRALGRHVLDVIRLMLSAIRVRRGLNLTIRQSCPRSVNRLPSLIKAGVRASLASGGGDSAIFGRRPGARRHLRPLSQRLALRLFYWERFEAGWLLVEPKGKQTATPKIMTRLWWTAPFPRSGDAPPKHEPAWVQYSTVLYLLQWLGHCVQYSTIIQPGCLL